MTFCPNCGAQIPAGANACPSCGTFVNAQPQQPQYNVMPPMVYVKPKIPGRGLGIAGMVLAIIGLVVGFFLLVSAIEIADSYSRRFDDDMLGIYIVYSVTSILGVSLGGAGRSKGYRCGVSTSGVVMGIIGIVMYFISILLIASN